MNGHPRDSISTDLEAGRPTISAHGDALARRVMALLSSGDAEKLDNRIYSEVATSSAFGHWVLDPTRYLADFDPASASNIEVLLKREHDRLLRRAKSQSSEVDETAEAE